MYLQLPLSISVLLELASARLASVTETPDAEAEWLLAGLLGCTRTQLLLGDVAEPNAQQAARFEQWLSRRVAGEPFAYITGEQPFHTLILRVTPDVLIPRADTEHLVDWALQLLLAAPASRVLDVCTGSGCVALAIAATQPSAEIIASDISPAALRVALDNAARLGLHRVKFLLADGLPASAGICDLIVGNPPYIAEGDTHLAALAHEPRQALVSGVDGLECLRQLIAAAPAQLSQCGSLLMEHGHDQGAAVRALFEQAGFSGVQTRRDYGGNERVTGGYRP